MAKEKKFKQLTDEELKNVNGGFISVNGIVREGSNASGENLKAGFGCGIEPNNIQTMTGNKD